MLLIYVRENSLYTVQYFINIKYFNLYYQESSYLHLLEGEENNLCYVGENKDINCVKVQHREESQPLLGAHKILL